QESVRFLRDVARYQSWGPVGGGRGGDIDGSQEAGAGSKREQKEQFLSLSYMVQEYIVEGAPNEINISGRDKKQILDVYNLGEVGFCTLSERRRR
ncbi:unnamed protein product, partial [Ectocarpus fasciculatus]